MLIQSTTKWKSVEIIVIDDGSSDDTSKIAKSFSDKCDLKIIRHSTPIGRGFSINEGFNESKGEFLICFNGKKDTSPDQIRNILSHVGEADLIISYQNNTNERPFIRRLFSKLYTRIINIAFIKNLRYYNGSILIRKADFKKLEIKTSSYAYETELLLKLLETGCRYIEVPVEDIFEEGRVTRSFRAKNIGGVILTFLRLFFEINFISKEESEES